jgi:hypothetical protein
LMLFWPGTAVIIAPPSLKNEACGGEKKWRENQKIGNH